MANFRQKRRVKSKHIRRRPASKRANRSTADGELLNHLTAAHWLAGRSNEPSRGELLALQRTVGNRAVQRLLAQGKRGERVPTTVPAGMQSPALYDSSPHESEVSFPISARIRHEDKPDAAISGREDESHRISTPAEAGAVVSDSDSSVEGEDIEVTVKPDGEVEEEESDSVNSNLSLTTSIKYGGGPLPAKNFGKTRTRYRVNNVNVKHVGTVYEVSAAIKLRIRWRIQSRGRKDIASFLDPKLTQSNYRKVAKDLAPDMDSDGGRPARKEYWASDLTARHEKYHAAERLEYGKKAFEFSQRWLDRMTASSELEARNWVKRVKNRISDYYRILYKPGAEERAYGDGAPEYGERVSMIEHLGKAGKYRD